MFLIEVKHSGYCAAINTRVTVRGDGRDAFARRYSMRAMVLPVPHGLLWEKRRWRKEPPCFNPDLIPNMIDPTAQDAATQRDVLAFLATLTTYGGADDVRRIGTHAAVVFLAGDRVLKVKRAIRFPFLEYSTLEKRKVACEEENRTDHPALANAPRDRRQATAELRPRSA